MQVNFVPSVTSVAFKPSAALMCALLIAGCNAKVIEPMRMVTAPSLAPARSASEQAEPGTTHYRVPEASSVSFIPNASEHVVDLTY